MRSSGPTRAVVAVVTLIILAACSSESPVGAGGSNVQTASSTTGGDAAALADVGRLTIIVDAVPNDAQDFSFTTTGAGLAAFSLDDDADPTLSNTKVFSDVAPGSYTITASAPPAGWTMTGLSCSSGAPNLPTRTASLTIQTGDDVTCTFTFANPTPATLTLRKVVLNDDGGTKTVSDFPLTATGPTTITGASGTADVTDRSVPAGSYVLSELAQAGYTASAWVCNAGVLMDNQLSLAPGVSATCVITNDDQPPVGRLTIILDAIPNDAQDFAFTTTGTGLAAFSLDDDADPTLSNTKVFSSVAPGTYTVTESAPATGWTLTGLSCSSGVPNLGTRTASLTIQAGDDVICTFSNMKATTLTLRKVVVNDDGGTKTVSDFPLTATGPTTITGVSGTADVTARSVPPGSYVLSEQMQPGYTASVWVCDAGVLTGNQITLALGVAATCVVTNNDLPPTLTLKKTIVGSSAPFTFELAGAGVPAMATITPPTNGTATAATVDALVIQPGTYSITEMNLPASWILTDKGCTVNGVSIGTTPSATSPMISFTASYGQNIVCEFVNNQQNGSTTRAQGFWATHTYMTTIVWHGGILPNGDAAAGVDAADRLLCGASSLTVPEVFGGFWANIARKSGNGGQRTELERSRMQMLQQYLAAVLNVYAFGTPLPAGSSLAGARAAYCGTDVTAIQQYTSLLTGHNEQYDTGAFTPGASATPQLSRSTADIPFWDMTFQKP